MRRSTICAALCLGVAGIPSGCASVPARPVEFPPQTAPIVQREATYAKYRLHQHGNWFFGYRWSRADGDYSYSQIDPLLTEFSETRAIQSDSIAQTWTVGGLAVAGGACLGLAIPDSLSDKQSFGSKADTALYISGAVLVGAAFVVSALWEPRELSAIYNAALARKLSVSAARSDAAP
jgi:hypothetical protein